MSPKKTVPSYKAFKPSSKVASDIKSRNKKVNTKAELVLRSHVWRLGLRYRTHVKNLPGKPDMVFSRAKIVVFCDGDFWHGRDWEQQKKQLARRNNPEYWIPKIEYNITRDIQQTEELKRLGWHVIRIWEKDILQKPEIIAKMINDEVKKRIV